MDDPRRYFGLPTQLACLLLSWLLVDLVVADLLIPEMARSWGYVIGLLLYTIARWGLVIIVKAHQRRKARKINAAIDLEVQQEIQEIENALQATDLPPVDREKLDKRLKQIKSSFLRQKLDAIAKKLEGRKQDYSL
ncbi:MAG: hypothetical protein AAGN35_04595 [Bacteroidota bacterium]